MKGFGRTVKDALYSGYRNGITGIVISLILMGFFWLLGCGSDGKVDFTTSLMKGNIFIFYGIMMTLFNSLLSINGEISLMISMGCTRKAVVPGNMMGNLIFAFFMCVSCLICRWMRANLKLYIIILHLYNTSPIIFLNIIFNNIKFSKFKCRWYCKIHIL